MNPARQRITVLGSTGSVGVNTLDVIARHPDRFEVFALSASTKVDVLFDQCRHFAPAFAVMASARHAALLEEKLRQHDLPTRVLTGDGALENIAAHESTDAVMAAIVGAAGLGACLAAARAGKRLLLANKEALVVGGELFMKAVREGGATLLPIDSEHSAIFQSLPEDPSTWARRIEKIILTASGGPFRTRTPESLASVTPNEACAHPNWVMGRKISVDSATMMNKALEVIEARHLFGVAPEQIEVVIHPQSIVHSMVQFTDSSVIAQLGSPDMRVPIAVGLAWPDRIASGASRLDFRQMADMTFDAPDDRLFPGLQLAWRVLQAAPGTPAVLNAANEVAVDAFLDGRLRFDRIHAVNMETLEAVLPSKPGALADLMAIDATAREAANTAVLRYAR
ncbi:MAG: 1-deoxy-D-xylulose-5-phosphate reductoisomerase [Gammaproteobacteria bacterium]|nr:1-deoxy-D-xylulose-5-phosphate reductoisomerase [Gammaproteobacteria bacterium]MBU1444201.1 1-deoxy-D-xylulose-5-phosphate reductoisomerase [Gammaproteobacteria bacterium]MBU2288305.1 1-deoxy-D-xylulose-5-phosphate reductoisomerase [Gammaproteobacteria bacterium]